MTLAAPERWTGHRGDERTDVYAVGQLVYMLVTGRPAYGWGPTAREGHFLASLPADRSVPPALFQVLRIATDKAPSLRYPTAGALQAALCGVFERKATPVGIVLDPSTETTRTPPSVEDWIGPAETMDPAPHRVERHREPVLVPALVLLTVALLSMGLATLAGVAALGAWAVTRPLVVSHEQPVGSAPSTLVPPTPAAPAAPPAPIAAAVEPPAPLPTPGGVETVRVPVTFAYDSWEAQAAPGFGGFMDDARSRPGTVRLIGHTDDRGTEAANQLMGLGRAWSVSLLMVANGMQGGRIEIGSAGETQPVAPNDTASGRALNRRVMADLEPSIQSMLEARGR
ncbi:MAG: OmpA family protein [Myxococcales bacterium]|nr:OmpA family protein [Myxococcales bacterium]